MMMASPRRLSASALTALTARSCARSTLPRNRRRFRRTARCRSCQPPETRHTGLPRSERWMSPPPTCRACPGFCLRQGAEVMPPAWSRARLSAANSLAAGSALTTHASKKAGYDRVGKKHPVAHLQHRTIQGQERSRQDRVRCRSKWSQRPPVKRGCRERIQVYMRRQCQEGNPDAAGSTALPHGVDARFHRARVLSEPWLLARGQEH